MASQVSDELVDLEYVQRQPFYRCKNCETAEPQRLMEDHIIRKHLPGPGPYNCTECGKKFARRDAARGHVIKNHPKKMFAQIIMLNPEVGKTLLLDHAVMLDKDKGWVVAQEKVQARENRNQTQIQKFKNQSSKQRPKKSEEPPKEESEASEAASSVPGPSATESILKTPVLSLHPPSDELLLTPVSALSPLPVDQPAMPTLRDIMDVLGQLRTQQEGILSRMSDLEQKQEASQVQLDNIQKELTKNSLTCSSAQGENRHLGNSVAEMKKDMAALKAGNEKVVEAAKALTAATGCLDSIESSVDSLCMTQGVEAMRVKESVGEVKKQVDKVVASTTPVPEMAKSLKKVEEHIRTTSTSQTASRNQTRAAFREVMHGVQRSLDALDNRQGANLAPRNDAGRTEREDRARRPLYL